MSKRVTFTSEELTYLYGILKNDAQFINPNEPKARLMWSRLAIIARKLGYNLTPSNTK